MESIIYKQIEGGDIVKELSIPDIRNKLNPIVNLLAMIENNDGKFDDLIEKEKLNVKRCVNYLAQRGVYNIDEITEPFNITDTSEDTDWDKYIIDLDKYLQFRGYREYSNQQPLDGEDNRYYKQFDGYQIGIMIYDFGKFGERFTSWKKIQISYKCLPSNLGASCQLSIGGDIELTKFEEISKEFVSNMTNKINNGE